MYSSIIDTSELLRKQDWREIWRGIFFAKCWAIPTQKNERKVCKINAICWRLQTKIDRLIYGCAQIKPPGQLILSQGFFIQENRLREHKDENELRK